MLYFPHKCVSCLLLCQKRDACTSDDFFIVEMEDMVRFTVGTLSTRQIYDVEVTPLPKKTGNENVVGHVTC